MFFDVSGTIQLKDISNELPFAVKVINQNNQTFTYTNAIIATNVGPEFTQPNVFDPTKFQEFAVQDPCANFIVAGQDLSETKHYPLTFNFKSGTGTAGGFNVAGGDISQNGPLTDSSNSTVKVPAGNRLSATAGNYTFAMVVTDDDGAKSEATFRLGVNNPTITSIDPSYIIGYSSTGIDISLVGNYFIPDSSCSFQNQSGGAILPQSSTQYNSINNIIAKGVTTTAGTYDINFNNGSVALSTSNPFLTISIPTLTINSTTYTVQTNGSISPSPSFTAPSNASGLNYTMTSNITYPYKFTLKGGGGGGGESGGNGGQGGTTVGYFYVQSGVTYKLLVGAPGQKKAPGAGPGQSSFPGGGVAGQLGYGGTGGGYTGIFNSTTINQSNALLIAGAGGGGSWESRLGGQGGGSSGQAGQAGLNTGGGGGTQTQGGAASNVSGSTPGSALQGGSPGSSGDQGGGGAGGAGWYGGGGGSGNGQGASGGGGSGYIGGNNSSLGTGITTVGGGGQGGQASQGNEAWAGGGSIVIETI